MFADDDSSFPRDIRYINDTAAASINTPVKVTIKSESPKPPIPPVVASPPPTLPPISSALKREIQSRNLEDEEDDDADLPRGIPFPSFETPTEDVFQIKVLYVSFSLTVFAHSTYNGMFLFGIALWSFFPIDEFYSMAGRAV